MPWYIIIQLIALIIQFMFLVGTIYGITEKGHTHIGSEEKVQYFMDVCLYGNMICMCIVLLMYIFYV